MPDREYVLEQYETLRVEALTAAARGHGLSLLLSTLFYKYDDIF
jgi:hypothetical protein